MASFGPAGLFFAMALALALLIGFALLRVRSMPKLPTGRKRAYRIYPRTSEAAFGLLRRFRQPRGRR
jgi:hypothetical protein